MKTPFFAAASTGTCRTRSRGDRKRVRGAGRLAKRRFRKMLTPERDVSSDHPPGGRQSFQEREYWRI
jgi:hypothetical protein